MFRVFWRCVNEVQVDVIGVKQFKRCSAMLERVFVANRVATSQFRGDEQGLTLNAGFFDCLTYFVFVGVCSSGVDVGVASSQGSQDRGFAFTRF